MERMLSLRFVVVASLLVFARCYRLEVTRQPVGNVLKGRTLEQQPAIRVILTELDEIGALDLSPPAAQAMIMEMENGGVVDVNNSRMVTISLETNPTGADLAGAGVQQQLSLKNGALEFTDLSIVQGGVGFRLMFSVLGSDGMMLTATSEPFDCGGQEAHLRIVQQPIVNVASTTVPPVILVQDANGRTLPTANPLITVSVHQSPVPGSYLTDRSMSSLRAEMGRAEFTALYLSHAGTQVEDSVPSYLEQAVLYVLKFSSPGFLDVLSEPFEAFPEVVVDTWPRSDNTLVHVQECRSSAEDPWSCALTLQDYLPLQNGSSTRRKSLQAVTLDVEVACTDLDAPGEVVRMMRVGDDELQPPLVELGPWEGCAFAGCRGQCEANMRKVVAGMDVKSRLGAQDPRTGIYSSDGPPLPVAIALSESVNICGCGSGRDMLVARATLTMQVAQDAHDQGRPLFVQPTVSLRNADGSLYTRHSKSVAAVLSTNSAHALVGGSSQLMSVGGVVAFTDLSITEGGPEFVMRFVAVGTGAHNMSVYADAPPIAVGRGNFPVLSLSCVSCDQPRTSKTAVYRALTRPPIVQLQNVAGGEVVQSGSGLRVDVMIGENGPGGTLEGEFRAAEDGLVNFEGLTLYNGNCNDCVNQPLCGGGYTLVFRANDVSVESQAFDVPGGNRSPRWILPTPPAGAVIRVPIGTTAQVQLNATDSNMNDFTIRQVPHPATGELAADASDVVATPWGAKVEILVPNNEVCRHPLDDDFLPWGISAAASFTPSCAVVAPEYPGPAAMVPVCFRAEDTFEENSINVVTQGELRCLHMHVVAPSSPVFVAPYYWDAVMAGLDGIAEPVVVDRANLTMMMMDGEGGGGGGGGGAGEMMGTPPTMVGEEEEEEEEEEERPRGLDPGAAVPMRFETGVGCTLRVPLTLEDRFVDSNGSRPMLSVMGHRTTATSLYGQEVLPTPLPAGAVVDDVPRANPYHSALVWQPRRGEEGRVYTICLKASTQYNGCEYSFFTAPYQGHRAQYCVEVSVVRCRYCMVQGDSFMGLAASLHSTYTQLWAGNPHLVRPSQVPTELPLQLGPVYSAAQDDTLRSLALKFAVSVESLLTWNPDLPRTPDMLAGTAYLLTSEGAYEPGMAPWSVRNGTRVPDSQGVCFLPDVCHYEALPAATAKQSSFHCSVCEEGREYCAGRQCVEGDGLPPWPAANCTRYVGTRCQLCRVCRAEELDYAGHVTVAGEYRSGGCDGEGGADAVCSPCRSCGAGEIEVSPCTPMQDRVCEKVSPVASGTAFVPV